MSNPFASAEAWDATSGWILAPGDYVVKISEVEDGTAGTGNPQAILKFECVEGGIRSWETYHDRFLSKIVSLFDAAGLDRPVDGEFDPNDKCRINQRKLDQLVGKDVGIVVREEADNRPDHYGETQTRVKGYLKPADIEPTSTTGAGGNAVREVSAFQGGSANGIDAGLDIPF